VSCVWLEPCNHYRCALCRTDLGYGADHPRLCEECAERVTPVSARDAFARGYAAAVWHAFCVAHKRPHEEDPPREPDLLAAWVRAR